MQRVRGWKYATCVLLSLLLAGIFNASAQTPTGAIEGTVTDPTGAVIPKATVTIAEAETGRTISLVTDEGGRYSQRNLLPGAHNIKIEAPGFAVREIRNVMVSTGSVINGSAALEIGRTGEVVTVTAEAVMVDTSRQTVDTIVTEAQIKNLPLFSRNFLDLAGFAPGTTIRDGGAIDPTKEFAYRTIGIAGRSGTGTRVQVDGIDVTDETVGTTTANLSQDAVHEFQLSQSSLDMSTSLTSSGAINIISKSGTNRVRGTAFSDYYNQDMGARLDYQPEAQPFHRKRVGGSAGGPFAKDKLFWFGQWERHYQSEQRINTAPEFPQLNVAQEFPVGIRYASGRLDWNARDDLRVFYRVNHDWNLATGGSAVSPFQNVNWTNVHTIGVNVNKARTTHSFRFGYVNFNNRIQSQELDFKFPRTPNGIPYYLGVGDFQAGPNSLAPQATYQDNFQSSYEGTLFLGRHNLRYGLSVTRIVLGGFANFAGPLSVNGTFNEASKAAIARRSGNVQDPLEYPFESFTMGPANGFFTLKAAHGLPHGGHFNTRTAWFAGDSIKLGRRLTLNLGLRWEYDTGYYNNDRSVPRDSILERWVRGASEFPTLPKTLFNPSFGFAWDPVGTGKTVIRGGFYRGYEMNIYNNLIFDEFSMLPAGIGPDVYDNTHVTGPDGTVINVDGRHADGDYSDLIDRPIKDVIGLVGQVQSALINAYSSYQFDPKKGVSSFRNALGVTFGGVIPGNQFKIPYGLQFNIGVQRELMPGMVLQLDYVHNHGVGLPFYLIDYERRRDAGTLNVSAARARLNTVLGGRTVDQWIAANPGRTISSFGLVSDAIWQGLYPDINRARLFQGGFTKYRGLQASLRSSVRDAGFLRGNSFIVSYALSRSEASSGAGRAEFLTGPFDNREWNKSQIFGPMGLDYTHILRAAWLFTVPGGFQFNSNWFFRTAAPQTFTVPNFGGAISGVNGFFGTDINGDGGVGTTPRGDVLPGMNVGQFGRSVKSLEEMNRILQAFNQNFAGKITPHSQALVSAGLFSEAQLRTLGAVVPTIPLVPTGNPEVWHNVLTADLRFSRPVNLAKVREGMQIVPFVDFFNLFNHAPRGLYGGLGNTFGSLNYDYSKAGPGLQASDLDFGVGRLNSTRKVQIGIRVDF